MMTHSTYPATSGHRLPRSGDKITTQASLQVNLTTGAGILKATKRTSPSFKGKGHGDLAYSVSFLNRDAQNLSTRVLWDGLHTPVAGRTPRLWPRSIKRHMF